MRFKTLRQKDNKEFVHLGDNYCGYEISIFTSDMPKLMGINTTMDDILKHCGGKVHDNEIQKWELVELNIDIIDDIKNN